MKQVLPNALGAMMPVVAAKSKNPLAAMMLMNGGQDMNPLMAMAMMGNENIGGQFSDQYGAMERPGVGTTEQPFRFGDYTGGSDPIVDQIINVESGGNPNARNPLGSAGGLGQFIDSTWMGMLRKHRPDLARRPDALQLKFDPGLSREMTSLYVKENLGALENAGLPQNPTTAYLAHFLGAGGAIDILKRAPSTPLSEIKDEAFFRSNPITFRGKSVREMTVGDLIGWAQNKMAG